jgi:dehydrogenase/reductase SDR family protein 13
MTAPDLRDRRFLVTGANTGIGRATAEGLAARGARLTLACRSLEKTQPVLDDLRRRFPASPVEFLPLDLADLTSVRAAAASYLASGAPLDVLINNAGIASGGGLTAQGFELVTGTNHLGPFLLTQLLTPLLMAAPQGRVVNVASGAHTMVRSMDWDALRKPTPSGGTFRMYGVSKLMNILHARELARRLTGTRVTTYALHPGVVASDIWRGIPQPFRFLMTALMISNAKGARTSLYCATSPDVATATGRYYDNRREVPTSALANDVALGRELWEWSDAAVMPAPTATR